MKFNNSKISNKKKKISENNFKNYELISNGNNSYYTSDKEENHKIIDKDFMNYRFDLNLNKKANLKLDYENNENKSENLTQKYNANNKRSSSKNKKINDIDFQSNKQILRNEKNDNDSNKNLNKIMISEEKEKLNLSICNKNFENKNELKEDKRVFDSKQEDLVDISIKKNENIDGEYENEEFYQDYEDNKDIIFSENNKQNNYSVEKKNRKEDDEDIIYNNNDFGNYENDVNSMENNWFI